MNWREVEGFFIMSGSGCRIEGRKPASGFTAWTRFVNLKVTTELQSKGHGWQGSRQKALQRCSPRKKVHVNFNFTWGKRNLIHPYHVRMMCLPLPYNALERGSRLVWGRLNPNLSEAYKALEQKGAVLVWQPHDVVRG